MPTLQNLASLSVAMFACGCSAPKSAPEVAAPLDSLPTISVDTVKPIGSSLCAKEVWIRGTLLSSLWCEGGKCTSANAYASTMYRVGIYADSVDSAWFGRGLRLATLSLHQDSGRIAPSTEDQFSFRIGDSSVVFPNNLHSGINDRYWADTLKQWIRCIDIRMGNGTESQLARFQQDCVGASLVTPATRPIWTDSLKIEAIDKPTGGVVRVQLASGSDGRKWLGTNVRLFLYVSHGADTLGPRGEIELSRIDTLPRDWCLESLLEGNPCEIARKPDSGFVQVVVKGEPLDAGSVDQGKCFEGGFELGTPWVRAHFGRVAGTIPFHCAEPDGLAKSPVVVQEATDYEDWVSLDEEAQRRSGDHSLRICRSTDGCGHPKRCLPFRDSGEALGFQRLEKFRAYAPAPASRHGVRFLLHGWCEPAMMGEYFGGIRVLEIGEHDSLVSRVGTIIVNDQSQAEIVDDSLLVAAQFQWGQNETRYVPHRFKIRVWNLNRSTMADSVVFSYVTRKKYPSLDDVDTIDVIPEEVPAIRDRLRKLRTQRSKARTGRGSP